MGFDKFRSLCKDDGIGRRESENVVPGVCVSQIEMCTVKDTLTYV